MLPFTNLKVLATSEPQLDLCAMARGACFRWGLRMGLRAQQNTPRPGRGPLERLGSQIKSQRGPSETWGPLELVGALDQELMVR